MGRKPTAIEVRKKRIMLILKSRNISIQKLADMAGHTRPGLSSAINRQKMEPMTLNDICKYLDVYPGFFTGEYPLRKLKPAILKNGVQIEGETWGFSEYASDPSGYDVPKYDYNKQFEEIMQWLHSRYDAIENAYKSIGSKGIYNPVKEERIHFDADFIENNKKYLLPEGLNALEKIILSVVNNSDRFKRWKTEEEISEIEREEMEKQLPDLWDVYQDEDLPE